MGAERIQLGIEEIDRKYEILEKMGEGGMGAIYKVRHLLLEEVRVIKTIRAHLKDQDEHQQRFLREARMATQLRHPGIAQTHDFGIGEDGSAYIVMEFIDGIDLVDARERAGLTQAEVLEVADQTLDILTYLHARKLVHRDISPDNIMLTRDHDGRLEVKLIDLGIAKQLEASQNLTRTGFFLGKLKYASPEQLGAVDGRKVTTSSDLYSFGIVLYELLTGRFPISGDSEAAILAGHLLHPPMSFEESDPEATVSAPLRAAVLRALEKIPEQRYASADEFRQTLARASSGSGAAAAGAESAAAPPRPAVAAPPASRPAAGPRPAVEPTVVSAAPRAERRLALPGRRTWIGLAAGVALALGGAALWQSGLAGRLLAGGDRAERPGPGVPPRGERPGPPPGPPAALAELDFGSYHALVIGNNDYRQLPALETAVRDAREIADLLESRYGFRVTLVTNATRREMITALTEVTESLSARDNLLLYYAGHGWLDDQSQAGYWQPVDAEPFNTANWVSTRHEVSAVLNRTPARQILVVADSCYAGALSELAPPPGPAPIGPDHVARVRNMLSRRSRLALTSGGLSPVLDQGDGRHSVFSKALLEVLGANSRIVEISRLFGQIRERVVAGAARFGIEQGPELAPIAQAGDEGGDFFFVPARPTA